MRYRRSCRKCVEFDEDVSLDDIQENGPPDSCMTCRRFYPDRFVPKEDE